MPQRGLILLLLCAAIVFTANAHYLSLLSLDDCFYARKGTEQGRSGRFFTVTWNYQVAFQNPPLQFWILGRSFRWFGENDFSARLPSILMALGILLATYRIGQLTIGGEASLAGISLLLLSPQFISNARRCMLEIPTAFWITVCFWILLEGLRRPRILALVAIPLGAALLTKSLLGLLPVAVFLLFCIWNTNARSALRKPVDMVGVRGWNRSWGFVADSSMAKLRRGGIAQPLPGRNSRAIGSGIPFLKRIYGYPLILLGAFQPVILPAIAGIRLLWVRKSETLSLLLWWAILPVVAYSFSSAQSSRYIFPILPALALCGGYGLHVHFPRATHYLHRWITPALLLLITTVFWMKPTLLLRDENRVWKDSVSQVQQVVAEEEERLTYLGNRYWKIANPLLYYADRSLETPSLDLKTAITRAKSSNSRSMVCDREFFLEMQSSGETFTVVMEDAQWLFLTLKN